MWDLIFNPLVTLLTWLYAIFGNNIVVAIVVLTLLIRIVTYPLTAQQMNSTKRMQELQPELKRLQEKYKDDREKLAQEQMALYREAGVNPLGGCFPLLIQFPILIGLYQAIFYALASTPYQLVDLSERLLLPTLDSLIPLQNTWLGMNLTQPPTPPVNPTYSLALPVLVMATTWLQFKMTMPKTSPDANDQAAAMNRSMGTIMPVMFGAFALSFSVGLSIYFITSNVIGIVQYVPAVKRFLDSIFVRDAGAKKPAPALQAIISSAPAKPTPAVTRTPAKTAKTPASSGKSYGGGGKSKKKR